MFPVLSLSLSKDGAEVALFLNLGIQVGISTTLMCWGGTAESGDLLVHPSIINVEILIGAAWGLTFHNYIKHMCLFLSSCYRHEHLLLLVFIYDKKTIMSLTNNYACMYIQLKSCLEHPQSRYFEWTVRAKLSPLVGIWADSLFSRHFCGRLTLI